MLNKQNIEKCRTPSELREFVREIRNDARNSAEHSKAAHLKSGLYKEFFDEIVPLSIFCSQYYKDDVKIKPILGNQGFDAEVVSECGTVLERIEITNPIDGFKRSKEGEQLVDKGITPLEEFDPGKDLDELRQFIENTCGKKSVKDYSDCIMIISIDYLPPHKSFRDLYEKKLLAIGGYVESTGFNAKKLFLVVTNECTVMKLCSQQRDQPDP